MFIFFQSKAKRRICFGSKFHAKKVQTSPWRQEAGNGLFDCTTSTLRRVRHRIQSYLCLPFFLTLLCRQIRDYESLKPVYKQFAISFLSRCQTTPIFIQTSFSLYVCILDLIDLINISKIIPHFHARKVSIFFVIESCFILFK